MRGIRRGFLIVGPDFGVQFSGTAAEGVALSNFGKSGKVSIFREKAKVLVGRKVFFSIKMTVSVQFLGKFVIG